MMSSSYEKEFDIFSANVNYVARSFYYYSEINNQVLKSMEEDPSSSLYLAIDRNARFWTDYKYSALLSVFIVLSRVFDKQKSSHGIPKLLKIARSEGCFKRECLRKRKRLSLEASGLCVKGYVKDTYELDLSDEGAFVHYIDRTAELWEKLKPARNKIFAHQDKMTAPKKSAVLKSADFSEVECIVMRLLTIEYILQEAFNNGTEIAFPYKNTKVLVATRKEITSLLSQLS